jgi:hypothetical protein
MKNANTSNSTIRSRLVTTRDQLDACKYILSFLQEFDLTLDPESLEMISSLHNGTHSDINSWQVSEHRHEWIQGLQSLPTLPSIHQIQEVKEYFEKIMDKWLNSF